MSGDTPKLSLFGVFSRRARWGLTWRGWLASIVILLAIVAILIVRIHPFLAITKPVETSVMVVEGWISMPSLQVAAEQFRAGGYEKLYAVAGSPSNAEFDPEANYGESVANQFLELGIPPESVFAVSSGNPQRDRTYTSAVSLRNWFEAQGMTASALNVVTEGPHSRRSRLMFEAAFGDDVSIGVISVPDTEYDTSRWWRYSEGVKEVVSESAAYFYARFLFRAED
jgi:uncharacterized SAM-binding protein YcdF (DUF218 family)